MTSSSELKNSSFCCSFTFLALVVGPLFLPSIGMVSCNPLKDTNYNFSIISSGSVLCTCCILVNFMRFTCVG